MHDSYPYVRIDEDLYADSQESKDIIEKSMSLTFDADNDLVDKVTCFTIKGQIDGE